MSRVRLIRNPVVGTGSSEVTLGTSAGTATSVNGATVLRLVNVSGATRKVTVVDKATGGIGIGSFSMPNNTTETVEKLAADLIFADGAVLATQVGFTG